MFGKNLAATVGFAMALIAVSAPASGAIVTLTFDWNTDSGATNACTSADGGSTSQLCTGNGQFIGSDYGTTAQLAVSYDPSRNWLSLRTADGGGANITGAFGFGQTDFELSKIFFTPASGYEVSFVSFDYAKGSATGTTPAFQLKDASDNSIFNLAPASPASNVVMNYSANTAYYGGPLTFLFGTTGSGGIVVDNITLDVREVSVPAVPLPAAAWLLLSGLGGLGLLGRRKTTKTS